MSRKRSISTEISVDEKVNAMISKHGFLAGLLYTWLIPHADDFGEHSANAYKIKMNILPGLNVGLDEIQKALDGFIEFNLIEIYDGKLLLPLDSFYYYQKYINSAKQEKAQNTRKTIATQQSCAKAQETALNLEGSNKSAPKCAEFGKGEGEGEGEGKREGEGKKGGGTKKKISWPKGFVLTTEMKQYALDQNIRDGPEKVFEAFRLKAHANGYTYVDWVAAWQGWCRHDYTPKKDGVKPEQKTQAQKNIDSANEWLAEKLAQEKKDA